MDKKAPIVEVVSETLFQDLATLISSYAVNQTINLHFTAKQNYDLLTDIVRDKINRSKVLVERVGKVKEIGMDFKSSTGSLLFDFGNQIVILKAQ